MSLDTCCLFDASVMHIFLKNLKKYIRMYDRIYTYKTVRPKKARTADHKVQSQLQSSSLHIAQFVDHI